ncbi:MAG TPA: PIG-L deacetylase family protein [Actinomycetota bacterium]|nr:PIG-L deacetylase family protein [Actinomycetota bacterium]
MLAIRRALAIGAHPDDVELQAGGTLAAWAGRGVHVELACFTAGEKGSADPAADPERLAGVRRAEAEAAARSLGTAVPVHFLGAVDGELEVTMALRLAVARLVRTVRPDVVLGHDPWRRDLLHPDHRAAGLLTVDGVVAARDPLYAPQLAAEGLGPHRPHTVLLFGTDAPDELVDVTVTIDAKLASLRAHVSQIGDHADLERRVRTWNAAIGAGAGLLYAEAFHTLDTRGR